MKNKLAENMLRFGVKNLTELDIKRINEKDPEGDDPRGGSVTQSGSGKGNNYKSNPDVLVDTDYLEATSAKIKTYKKQNPNFDSQLSELKSHAGYKLLLSRLEGKGPYGGQPTNEREFFYLFLTQDSRKKFLDQTLAFTRSFTKKRKLQKRLEQDPAYTGADELYNFQATLAAGDIEKFTIQVEKGPDEIEFQAIKIPLLVSGDTTYKDMSTEPGSKLIQSIEEWTKKVRVAIAAAKQVNPNVIATCSKMDVSASSSRLRNSTNITWSELSQGRAKVINKKLIEILQGQGVLFDPKMVTILRAGTNSDGSSGPNPPSGFVISETGAKSSIITKPTPEQINKFGKPHAGRADYHQYKNCVALATVIVKADEKLVEPVPMQPSYTYERGFTLELAPLYYSKPLKRLKKHKSTYKPSGKTFNQSKTGISLKDVFKAGKHLSVCPAFFGPGS